MSDKPLPLVNMLTVDVEDYFHVAALASSISPDTWETRERRVVANTDRLLNLFAESGVRATFFVLGWVAERHPDLVRRIAAADHEVGAHSYGHGLVYEMTPDQFRDDLRRVRDILQDAVGRPVVGYRAPSFSITARSLWAYEILAEEGFRYSASVFPIHHDIYGMPGAPRAPHVVGQPVSSVVAAGANPSGVAAGLQLRGTDRSGILEVPSSTVRLFGQNLPVGGGGYLRILPYAWTRWGIRRLNSVDRLPAMVYMHPWEIDPGQPRIPVPLRSRFRHYSNVDRMEGRLRRLLRDFRFDSVSAVLFGPDGRLCAARVPAT